MDTPEILDDFELPQEEAIDIKDMQVNKLKLSRRINNFKVSTSIQFHYLCIFISMFVFNMVWVHIHCQCKDSLPPVDTHTRHDIDNNNLRK